MKSYKVSHISPLKIACFIIIYLKEAAYLVPIFWNVGLNQFAALFCFIIIGRTLDLLKSELSAFSVSAVGM